MSGKSRLLINLAASFYPHFVSRPISQIVYVGNSWTPEYEKRLRSVGKALKVKTFMCQGLDSEIFQKSWERKLQALHSTVGKNNENKIKNDHWNKKRFSRFDNNSDDDENNDYDNDDSNDDNDDNDEDRVLYSRRVQNKYGKTKLQSNLFSPHTVQQEACTMFIDRLLKRHKRQNAKGKRRRADRSPSFFSHEPRERKLKDPVLAKRPKLSTSRKLKRFLNFEDSSLRNLGSLALEKNPTGGRVVTRSATRQSDQPALRQSEQQQQQQQQQQQRPSKRKLPEKLPKMDDYNKNDDDDDNDDENDVDLPPLSKKSRKLLDTQLERESGELIDFPPRTLLLLDDVLTGSSGSRNNDRLDSGNSNPSHFDVARKIRDAFTANLQFVQSLATEYSHHAQISFCVTSQSTLSSSGTGSNAAARALRIIRQNTDAHILFQQPVRDVRSMLQNLSVGKDFQILKNIFNHVVDNAPGETASDLRSSHPYLCLCLTNNTERRLRIREHFFNLYDADLKPFVPPSFINYARSSDELQQQQRQHF